MTAIADSYSPAVNLGLLLGRTVLGLLMAGHGAQKLLGWFGGRGLNTTGEFFVQLGFRPGRLFATAASAAEVGSGLLVALGFLGPIGPALLISVMIVAAFSVHWRNGVFAQSNGIELPLIYASGAAALALIGPGRYSLDHIFGLSSLWTPAITGAALALGIIGGVANLALRRPAPRTPTA
jgi:putative oxidoreductase